MASRKEIDNLADELTASQKTLTALGNEVRLHLILCILRAPNCNGMRVGEITNLTNLSRPAVSHHLQILKDAGIMKVRKEGTRYYYYFDAEEPFQQLIEALQKAEDIMKTLPDRSGENDW